MKMAERTIRVTGKGNIAVKPDMIRLTISQSGLKKDYADAIKDSAEKKAKLTDALTAVGFTKQDLKTLRFNVDTKYEYREDKDKTRRRHFVGYEFSHRMKLDFDNDNKLLGRVLRALVKCEGKPEFTIAFTVKNPDSAKNELLGEAVKDSMAKARVLTSAAGVSLGEIKSIDYSWSEMEIYSRPLGDDVMYGMCCEEESGPELDIEADDIKLSDTVTVIWGIE